MADELLPVGQAGSKKRLKDMADGSWAEAVYIAGQAGGGSAVSIADGSDVAEGATADAAVAAGAAGTVSAKLRRVTQGLEDLKTLIVLAAGSAIIGKVTTDQTTPGTTDKVSVSSTTGAGLAVGTTADAAVTTDANGTMPSFLRGIVTILGAVTASPVANTIGDRLKALKTSVDALLTGIVLGAGENHVGAVGGTTATVRVEKVRVADGNAYAANDAIDVSTTVPTGLTFVVGRAAAAGAAGSGVIIGAHVATDQTTCVARFEVDLYDAAPTYINDNAEATRLYANAGASGKFLKTITFPAVAKKTTNSTQAEAANDDVRVPFKCVGSSSIYGILRTLDAFTPASGQKFTITLYPAQD